MAKDRDPWIAVDATIRVNHKLAGMPNDTARWGWICILGEAKTLRPPGRFASRRHFTEIAGRFGKFLALYLTARLLEEAPRLCDRCQKSCEGVTDGTLVVHDWALHQRDPGAAERAKDWRDERIANAERTHDERTANDPRTLSDTALSRAQATTATATATSDKELPKAITATALPKPRAQSPTNEPRLTEPQLDSWDSFGSRWERFKKAWLGRGLLYAPFGSPDDDDTSQRGLLFQVLDARPNDVVRWVEEAPKPVAREVITYILEQWHEARAAAGVDDDEWQEAKDEERHTAGPAMSRISEVLARP